MALVQQVVVEQSFQRPPNRFDVAFVVGHVSVVQLHPKAESLGQLFPVLHVGEDALLAFVDERFDAVFFDVFFGVDAEFFADFDFDGQTVGVPTGFATAVKTFHGFVTREHVFDRAGQAVTGVRFPVGGGRAFEEHILFGAFTLLERSIVDVFLAPEF